MDINPFGLVLVVVSVLTIPTQAFPEGRPQIVIRPGGALPPAESVREAVKSYLRGYQNKLDFPRDTFKELESLAVEAINRLSSNIRLYKPILVNVECAIIR